MYHVPSKLECAATARYAACGQMAWHGAHGCSGGACWGRLQSHSTHMQAQARVHSRSHSHMQHGVRGHDAASRPSARPPCCPGSRLRAAPSCHTRHLEAPAGSSSPHLRASAAAVALAAPCLRAHSEQAGRVSPVATCRAVHVLARSQKAGMDVWNKGARSCMWLQVRGQACTAAQHST